MRKQLRSISVWQATKVACVLYFLFGLIYTILGVFILTFSEEKKGGGLFFIFMPVIMVVFGSISVSVGCWLYNEVAKRIGGIEFTLEDTIS